MKQKQLLLPHSNPGRLIKIENNITQLSAGREANFSNVFTTFGGYFFTDIDDGDFTWASVTSGTKIWFTAGTGTSGTGASNPAAASDYQMATPITFFETGGGTPAPQRQVDSFEENTALGELVMVYAAKRSDDITGEISEVGIYMSNTYTGWSSTSTDRSTYDLMDIYQAPQRPTLIARSVVPAENRITKAAGNDITWRWTLKFTG